MMGGGRERELKVADVSIPLENGDEYVNQYWYSTLNAVRLNRPPKSRLTSGLVEYPFVVLKQRQNARLESDVSFHDFVFNILKEHLTGEKIIIRDFATLPGGETTVAFYVAPPRPSFEDYMKW